MWNVVSHIELLAWLGAIALVSAIRLWHVSSYAKADVATEQAGRWLAQYVAGTAVTALLWGSASLLFMPDGIPLYQVVTLILLTGLSAAAVTTYASSLLAYRVFLWLCMTPMAVVLATKSEPGHLAASAVVFIYIVMMSQRAAVMVNKAMVDSIRRNLKISELLELNTGIINHTDSGITLYKPAGECVLMNDAARRILGIPAQLDVVHNFRTIPDWQEHGLIEAAEVVLRTGTQKSLDLPMRSIYG